MFEEVSNTALLIGVVVILFATWIYFNIRRPPGMPPGPTPLPVIGNVTIFMGKTSAQEVFQNMTSRYGPLISVKFGSSWAVVINNYELAQEALLAKPTDFSGRPHLYLVDWLTDGQKDIAFSQPSPTWKFHRKLAHTAIRKYATGKYLEDLVAEVTPKVRDVITQKAGKPFNPKEVITLAVYNVIASMCFGHKYNFKDPQLTKFIKLSDKLNTDFGNGTLADFIPLARFLPSPQVNRIKKSANEFFDLIKVEVSQHLKTFSPEESSNDLIDMLLQAQIEESDNADDENKLTDVHLKQIVGDLFGAGTDTTTTTLLWAIACMIDNPATQDKINQEISNVIGDRPPRIADRGKLPYTEAAIMEIMRFGTVAPLGLTHRAVKDSTIGHYNIPENTWVFINHWALHNDTKYWDSPDIFLPERFLDSTSVIKQRLPSFLPFSTGRRVCVGEALAKSEVFLLFVWLIQNYEFSKEPGVIRKVAVSGNPQGLNFPEPFKTVASPR